MRAWILFICLFAVQAQAASLTREAKIYALGRTNEPPVFIQKTQLDTDQAGFTHETTEIRDSKGQLVLTQESHYDGEHLKDQHVRQYQTAKAFTVKVEQNHVTFQTFEFDGTTEKPSSEGNDTEKLEGPLLTGPVSDNFLRAHWKELMDGDTIHVRFGVLELAETVGFKFWKLDSPKIAANSKPLVDIRMKPSSVFIGMAVNSIELLFDPTTHQMMEYQGRTPLRVRVKGKLKAFDGDIIYSN